MKSYVAKNIKFLVWCKTEASLKKHINVSAQGYPCDKILDPCLLTNELYKWSRGTLLLLGFRGIYLPEIVCHIFSPFLYAWDDGFACMHAWMRSCALRPYCLMILEKV